MNINFFYAKQGFEFAHAGAVVTQVLSSPLPSNSLWLLSRCQASRFIPPATISIPLTF